MDGWINMISFHCFSLTFLKWIEIWCSQRNAEVLEDVFCGQAAQEVIWKLYCASCQLKKRIWYLVFLMWYLEQGGCVISCLYSADSLTYCYPTVRLYTVFFCFGIINVQHLNFDMESTVRDCKPYYILYHYYIKINVILLGLVADGRFMHRMKARP